MKISTLDRLTALLNGPAVRYEGAEVALLSFIETDNGAMVRFQAKHPNTGKLCEIMLGSGELESTVGMWERQLIRKGLSDAQVQVCTPQDAGEIPSDTAEGVGTNGPELVAADEQRFFIVFGQMQLVHHPKPEIVLRGQNPMQANTPRIEMRPFDVALATPGHYPVKEQVVAYVKDKMGAAAVAIMSIVEVSEADMQMWELPLAVEGPKTLVS